MGSAPASDFTLSFPTRSTISRHPAPLMNHQGSISRMTQDSPPRTPPGPIRMVLLGLGCVLSALALLGAFLPILPTTPFLLLAAACFARSSQRLHQALMRNRFFGPYLRQWQYDRTIPRPAKLRAYALVIVTFTISVLWLESLQMRVLIALTGCGLLGFLMWLPTTGDAAALPRSPGPKRAPDPPGDS